MASSQAANLTGLLSGIGKTIGEMGGPGNALIDNVRTLNAPSLDPNDPASMRAYADWAMRNGDRQTAQQYQLAAGKLEQEQGARKAATDSAGFQRSLNKLEEARAQALQNAGGDRQAEAQINAQYDTAANAVSGKMNEMAGQYGLDTSGTQMLENAQGRRAVTEQLVSEIKSEKNSGRRAQLQRLLTGVESGMVSPQDAIEATTTGSLGGGNRSVQRSVNYKDGSIQTVYKDGTTEITTAAGNTFGPGDDGYEEATTGARDSGVSYAGDVAGATQDGKQSSLDRAEVAKEYVASGETEKTYLDAREVVAEMEDYSFGKVSAMFPNFSQGSIKLQNFKNEIGLKVIAGGNFGQLNETELNLALNQGIPDGLTKQETLDWIDRRIAAEQQVQAAAVDYMRWSKENPGGTRAEYIVDREIDEGKENEVSGGSKNDGANLSGGGNTSSQTIQLSSGATARKVN
jgi:hypothetical protein